MAKLLKSKLSYSMWQQLSWDKSSDSKDIHERHIRLMLKWPYGLYNKLGHKVSFKYAHSFHWRPWKHNHHTRHSMETQPHMDLIFGHMALYDQMGHKTLWSYWIYHSIHGCLGTQNKKKSLSLENWSSFWRRAIGFIKQIFIPLSLPKLPKTCRQSKPI